MKDLLEALPLPSYDAEDGESLHSPAAAVSSLAWTGKRTGLVLKALGVTSFKELILLFRSNGTVHLEPRSIAEIPGIGKTCLKELAWACMNEMVMEHQRIVEGLETKLNEQDETIKDLRSRLDRVRQNAEFIRAKTTRLLVLADENLDYEEKKTP